MIVEHKYRIVGKHPLMQHNPAGMAAVDPGASKKKIPTPTEEAELGTYRLPSGQLYIKSEAFRGAILTAASGFKIGKTAAKPILAAGVEFPDIECPLIHPTTGKPIHEYAIDIRRAVLNRKQAVMRSRPRIDEWACELRLMIDDEIIPDSAVVLMLLTEAGKRVGVCDQRPGSPHTPGPYGTFSASPAEAMPEKKSKGRAK